MNYFDKAHQILNYAAEKGDKDIKGSPDLQELIARIAFVTEDYERCINHNKKAVELRLARSESTAHNFSDIGYAYYKLALREEDSKFLDKGLESCRKSLQENPEYANAMVNIGLIVKQQGDAK